MLKPHGSFNWQICPICYNVQIIPFNETGATGGPYFKNENNGRLCINPICMNQSGQFVYTNLIIPPTVFKEFNLPLLKDTWLKSKIALEDAKEIHIIGYSFSEIDILSNFWFYITLYNNTKLNKIILVNPDCSVKTRLNNILPKEKQDKIELIKDFNDYIENVNK
jgi:hypothetical protein